MKPAELVALLQAEAAFFDGLASLDKVVLYGSALEEEELKDDVDLMVAARKMSGGELVDLRQAVWEKFKDRLPVKLEVVSPTADFSLESIVAKGVPYEVIYQRQV